MPKDKKKPDEKKEEPKGEEYVCRSPHDEPAPEGGFIKRKAGETITSDKNPGPYWRPAKEIKQIKEVSTDGNTRD